MIEPFEQLNKRRDDEIKLRRILKHIWQRADSGLAYCRTKSELQDKLKSIY